MKKILTVIVSSGIFVLLAQPVLSDEHTSSNYGGIESLRGSVEVSDVNTAESLKKSASDKGAIDRNYVQQPPLIPHDIRGYQVNLNANKCLSCHSFKNATTSGAPRISVTHYETRSGSTLSDVSPSRYFCLQCHVPQADAQPLVENNFTPVKSLR